jgi:hypothetical protein
VVVGFSQVSSNSASRKLGSRSKPRESDSLRKFPVIQLLGSLEATLYKDSSAVSGLFPVIQLLGSLEVVSHLAPNPSW